MKKKTTLNLAEEEKIDEFHRKAVEIMFKKPNPFEPSPERQMTALVKAEKKRIIN